MNMCDEIHRRAQKFCQDNRLHQKLLANKKDILNIIESAMMMGASIALEGGIPPIPGESEEGWKHVEAVFEAYHRERGTPRA